MKVDYEEVIQYYEAARNKTPGEWKDAIEAILDAVPELIARVRELERQKEFLISNFADNGLCFMPLDFGCSERSKNGCYCFAKKYMKEACARDRAEEAAKEAK